MKIVLLRHATRSAHGFGDSALNAIGLAQAEDLASSLSPHGKLPRPTRIAASPKRRARETVSPLAQTLRLPVDVDPRLDERHQHEAAREFENRIREVLDEAAAAATNEAQQSECWYFCSHLDWLEAALLVLPSDLSELEASMGWSTAEFRVFEFEDGIWKSKGGGAVPVRMPG